MRRIIGITGGIGSGKSFVSRVLAQRCGVPVYDCDSHAKQLMTGNAELRQKLVELIGPEAYGADGTLCRPVVAAYLFADARHAAQVNALVHPAVRADILCWADEQTSDVVAVETAILIESGLDEIVDEILFVEADENTRLARAMQRDAADADKIRARMARQQTAPVRNMATWVVRNEEGETEETIYKQIKDLGIC